MRKSCARPGPVPGGVQRIKACSGLPGAGIGVRHGRQKPAQAVDSDPAGRDHGLGRGLHRHGVRDWVGAGHRLDPGVQVSHGGFCAGRTLPPEGARLLPLGHHARRDRRGQPLRRVLRADSRAGDDHRVQRRVHHRHLCGDDQSMLLKRGACALRRLIG